MDVCNSVCFHAVMKADVRISIKDYHRNKNLKILLFRPPYPCHQFFVRMNGQPWPKAGGPVSLTGLISALRKALVKRTQTGNGAPRSRSQRYPAPAARVCQERGGERSQRERLEDGGGLGGTSNNQRRTTRTTKQRRNKGGKNCQLPIGGALWCGAAGRATFNLLPPPSSRDGCR